MNTAKIVLASVKLCLFIIVITLAYPYVSFATPVPDAGQSKVERTEYAYKSKMQPILKRVEILFALINGSITAEEARSILKQSLPEIELAFNGIREGKAEIERFIIENEGILPDKLINGIIAMVKASELDSKVEEKMKSLVSVAEGNCFSYLLTAIGYILLSAVAIFGGTGGVVLVIFIWNLLDGITVGLPFINGAVLLVSLLLVGLSLLISTGGGTVGLFFGLVGLEKFLECLVNLIY